MLEAKLTLKGWEIEKQAILERIVACEKENEDLKTSLDSEKKKRVNLENRISEEVQKEADGLKSQTETYLSGCKDILTGYGQGLESNARILTDQLSGSLGQLNKATDNHKKSLITFVEEEMSSFVKERNELISFVESTSQDLRKLAEEQSIVINEHTKLLEYIQGLLAPSNAEGDKEQLDVEAMLMQLNNSLELLSTRVEDLESLQRKLAPSYVASQLEGLKET